MVSSAGVQNTIVRVGELEINLHDQLVQRAGQAIRLTRLEWLLLDALVRHAGAILSHQQLIHMVWGDTFGIEDTYLRIYISRLRRKLGDDSAAPRYIVTEHDIGYRFVLPHAHADSHQPTNLPTPLTFLIGRDQALVQVTALLRQPVRLLTVTGPGGIGKTRLALQAATQLQDTYRDGVCFIDLATITDPALVLQAIGQGLGLLEHGQQSLREQIYTHLQAKHLLLLLDNFEHVIAAVSLIDELLAAAPRLQILVTSRVVLKLYGEHEFVVPPLDLPDPDQHVAPDTMAQVAAVALFVQRARSVIPHFQLTDATVPAVAAICWRLEGSR